MVADSDSSCPTLSRTALGQLRSQLRSQLSSRSRWQLGLKTGMYYLRTKAATDAIKFTVDVEKVRRASTASITPSTQAEAEGKTNKTEQDARHRVTLG